MTIRTRCPIRASAKSNRPIGTTKSSYIAPPADGSYQDSRPAEQLTGGRKLHDHFRYLAQFLGPKAENEDFAKNTISSIFMDYIHWRRNYFPDDPRIMSKAEQRSLQTEQDRLAEHVDQFIAGLRRSFPFYSPRYIGHQQSDTTLASLFGIIAGTLYNSNNVTPESGIATVEWEIDACNELLAMIGYRPPPTLQPKETFEDYTKRLVGEFGWCHLTSGGTVANIESLWVARTVKYFPLAVRDFCITNKVDLEIKLPNGTTKNIREISEYQSINLKSNESIFLLSKFAERASQLGLVNDKNVAESLWDLLKDSDYSPANGYSKSYELFPPVIMVSGAAHYSVEKAADVLGIGRNSIRPIDTDSDFRMDLADLDQNLRRSFHKKESVIAVVAIAGTTEEGAVDPLHKILGLRSQFHNEPFDNGEPGGLHSFWVHVDAAWGGFFRTLFHDVDTVPYSKVSECLFRKRLFALHHETITAPPLSVPIQCSPELNPREWLLELFEKIQTPAETEPQEPGQPEPQEPAQPRLTKDSIDGWFLDAERSGSYKHILQQMKVSLERLGISLDKHDFQISIADRVANVTDFVQDFEHTLRVGSYEKEVPIHWPSDRAVGEAIFAIKDADSVTVDPHKMGYVAYPNGAVAFKNDRVRHFITQEAPYITSSKHSALVHLPIREVVPPEDKIGDPQVQTQAFAPYTLEGSRPSSAACSLWLSTKALPLDLQHYGSVARASLLAARSLYEWLLHWKEIKEKLNEDTRYKIVLFTKRPPDTNIVIFGLKEHGDKTIEGYNRLNNAIYSAFSIQSELGEREYSYSQPFFLSKTVFRIKKYPYAGLQDFLTRQKFRTPLSDYEKHGLVVLRATVMSPYITPMRAESRSDLLAAFMKELHKAANAAVGKPGQT